MKNRGHHIFFRDLLTFRENKALTKYEQTKIERDARKRCSLFCRLDIMVQPLIQLSFFFIDIVLVRNLQEMPKSIWILLFPNLCNF